MGVRLKIDGIYNERTLQMIRDRQIHDIGFDLRPRSFNFIQGHRLLEVIKEGYSPFHRYFLHFCGEEDFVIKKIYSDVVAQLMQLDNIEKPQLLTNKRLILEFSDTRECEFYDQFQWPYFCHYHPMLTLEKLVRSEYCKGFILSYSYIEKLHEQGMFHYFVKNLMQAVSSPLNGMSFEFILEIDWDSNIFPSLFDFLSISTVALPINSKVELCYRSVDFDLMAKSLDQLTF